MATTRSRTRPDRCPGALRPWIADDGALVRLRLVGGHLPRPALEELLRIAEEYGDARVHLTSRANVQLRGLPHEDGALPTDLLERLVATGLLPSLTHELVRNIVVSPLTGSVTGGSTDLRPVAAALDAGLCAEPLLGNLSARFLFVLDDGRGDVLDRECDLGLVALDECTAQLRVGPSWGPVVDLDEAPAALLDLARAFVRVRGDGPDAPWHLAELELPLVAPHDPDPRLPVASTAPAPGPHLQDDGRQTLHVLCPDASIGRHLHLPGDGPVVVTPWRSVVVPDLPPERQTERPSRHYAYVDRGAAIYADSFATIRAEGSFDHLPADAEKVAVRMVHGTGLVDLARDLVIHRDLVRAARDALERGAPILTDAHMVASGVTRARLPRDNDVVCLLRDPAVPALAAAWETTRSAAALGLWGDRLGGAVVAIGNAPTALFHLLEMLLDGAPPPAAIIGCPVGFIGAAESKDALASFADEHGIDVPFLTVRGRRGGSAMTASALNALAQERE
nr:precorrin-8X methylmutase [Nocardioides sp.]